MGAFEHKSYLNTLFQLIWEIHCCSASLKKMKGLQFEPSEMHIAQVQRNETSNYF